ncbi:hypothetical protein BU25DRAFT_411017 [Macroventuria anomochaeta]|uniref:Uncharacterized protein n=1 Tax=Macroventuria anomochaeta TaxID=301207 RepID=A0ACB6S2Q3_9PLEO|nr:uncharacterized protein BU25DRAFT_411017 [Macroventuria anomochaeta]KAF2627412.1 hypothetical protein BU25DRAFT_411017 [Macroventuria anomochaeta]
MLHKVVRGFLGPPASSTYSRQETCDTDCHSSNDNLPRVDYESRRRAYYHIDCLRLPSLARQRSHADRSYTRQWSLRHSFEVKSIGLRHPSTNCTNVRLDPLDGPKVVTGDKSRERDRSRCRKRGRRNRGWSRGGSLIGRWYGCSRYSWCRSWRRDGWRECCRCSRHYNLKWRCCNRREAWCLTKSSKNVNLGYLISV